MGRRFHPTTDDALPLITDRFLMTDEETPILTPMANKGVALPQADRMPRRNLMLTASIKADGLEAPVRIRNLSVTGAMIEGPALPLPDTRLILRRLDVEIGARVVWVSAGRCGVQFEGTIAVEDWTPGIRHASAADLHGQARVDAIQAAIRSGETLPVEKTPGGDTTQGPVDLNLRLANELAYVRRLLDAIGEELVRDPIMMQRHGQALQSFDIACQLIDHLGVVVGADDPQAAAREVTIDDLRSRLVGKSIF